MQHVALGGERRRVDERHVPAVGEAGGDAQRPLLAARRRPRSAARPGSVGARCGPRWSRTTALERRLLVAQQAAQDGDALLQLVHAGADGREVDAVGLVLDLGPAGADAHGRPAARDQVDGRDRLGQHGRVAVADRVHERPALHPLGLAGQRGVHGDRLEAGGVVGIAGGAVEVVPDRDPVEAEGLDPLPQEPQLVGGGVLQAGVDPERRGIERPTPAKRRGHAIRTSSSSDGSPVRETAAMPRATVASTNPVERRARVRDVRLARRSGPAARHGLQRPADRLGRRFCEQLAGRGPLRDPLRQPRLRAVDPPRRPGRRPDGRDVGQPQRRRAAAGAVHAVGHGVRRRRPARPPRHRPGPRPRGVDGRDDRPDHRHRAPRPLPQPDVGDELARRPARRQADAGGAGRADDAAADRP